MISAQDHQCCHLVTRHLRNFNSCLGDFLTQDIQYRCHVSSKQGEKYHTQGKYLQMIYHLKNAATKVYQPLSTRLVRNIMVNFKPGGNMRKIIFHSIESLSLNQSQSTHAPTHPRFVIILALPLLLPTPTIWFSLDHKRNVSDGVVRGIGTLFSLDNKPYASG